MQSIVWDSGSMDGSTVAIRLYKGPELLTPVADIADNAPNNGSFAWIVPFTLEAGSDYRVEVAGSTNPYTPAYSDNYFTITQDAFPAPVVTAPVGGESWAGGSSHSITWSNITGTSVDIELYKGGTLDSSIAVNVANSGTFSWIVPTSVAAGTDYLVKVVGLTDTLPTDPPSFAYSDNFFEITQPGLPAPVVTAPVGGESWAGGSSQSITWSNITGTSVNIELYKGGALDSSIALNVANSGTFAWVIPADIASDADYMVKVTGLTDGAPTSPPSFAYSPNYFSIMQNLLRVTAPNGGEVWNAGSSYDITWSTEGPVGVNVRIDLYKGGELFSNIVVATPSAAGTYTWDIPAGHLPAADYTVRVSSVTDPSIYAFSFTDFEIAFVGGGGSAPVVTAPVGGELWLGGEVHTITWSNIAGTSVNIDLYKGQQHQPSPEFDSIIAVNVPNTGSFSWVVPASIISAADYLVKVTGLTEAVPTVPPSFAFSDNYFSIMQNLLRITSPNGGEMWPVGSSHDITWTTEGVVGTDVRIDLYKDGELFENLAVAVPTTDGAFTWDIPNTHWIGADFRVRITSVDDPSIHASSTADFELTRNDPTDIVLSNASIAENVAAGTLIGTLSAVDANGGDTFTYNWETEGPDSTAFQLLGNELRSAEIFDYEVKRSYTLQFRATDQTGGFITKQFTIIVTNVNEPPTALTLDNNAIDEGLPIGTIVGDFATTDPDLVETFTYTLVAGAGSADNGQFAISGNHLTTAAVFAFLTKPSYSIRVRTTDSGANSLDQVFTITVNDINGPPTDILLSNYNVDEGMPIGTLVGTLSTLDPNVGDTFTYRFDKDSQFPGNLAFQIVGGQLLTADVFTFALKSSYVINVVSTDQAGLAVSKTFTIGVNEGGAGNAAPVVTYPNGGESWAAGSTHTITWTSVGSTDVDVRIDLYKGGSFNRTIVLSTPNSGSYTWTVPTAQQAGTDYRVRVISPTNPILFGVSFADFAITYYLPTVTAPNGGEVWAGGTTQAITWDENGSDGANVNIDLYKAGALHSSIAANVPNLGSFSWTIPAWIPADSNYKVKVTSVANPLITASSNNYFSITQEALMVVVPNGGERWFAGSTHSVVWSSPAGAGANVRIDLYKNGVLNSVIAASTANDGSENWTIRNEQAADTDYTVRVTSLTSPQITGTSAGTFEVVLERPVEILLDSTTTTVQLPAGSLVGHLSTLDPNPGDSHTYMLVGGTNNDEFQISGNQLQTAQIFTAVGTRQIRVRSTDPGGLFYEKLFNITVAGPNLAPTDIGISNNLVGVNQPAGTLVGILTTTDPNPDDVFAYTLVPNPGASNNNDFFIAGTELQTAVIFVNAATEFKTVCVRSTDKGGLYKDKVFQITVGVNTPPELTAIGNKTVNVGSTLTFQISAIDQDGDTITYSANGLPTGATLVGRTFSWAPTVAQVGDHVVQFVASDGKATDFEDVTITVTNINPVLFYDKFSDGTAAGDPQWVKVAGAWTVDSGVHYRATSTATTSLSTVKATVLPPLSAGRIETVLNMLNLATAPNAMVVFGFQAIDKYRYVQVVPNSGATPGQIRLGQVGGYGGTTAGVKIKGAVSAATATTYALRIDAYPNGRVNVYFKGALALTYKFPVAVSGRTGVGVVRNGAWFDNFKVSDTTVLPTSAPVAK